VVPWRIGVDVVKDLPFSKERILVEVRATMARIGVDPEDVDPAAHLVDDLDLDSLDWVDFAMQLEDTLPVTLQEQKFASLRTVQDIVDRVYAALVETRDASD